ncbi:hypothetical protein Ancab_010949 [Ancistrocladus abbreviatus]
MKKQAKARLKSNKKKLANTEERCRESAEVLKSRNSRVNAAHADVHHSKQAKGDTKGDKSMSGREMHLKFQRDEDRREMHFNIKEEDFSLVALYVKSII